MKLPEELVNIPILEAIFEIRFEASAPQDAVTGIIYQIFKDEFNNPEPLPLADVPLKIRDQDPNLKFQPIQRMQSKDSKFIIQYGQRSFSIHLPGKYYSRWSVFHTKIKEVCKKLNGLNIIKKTNRVGLRYIDLLNLKKIKEYKFEDLNLEINIAGYGYGNGLSLSTNITEKHASHRINIFNNTTLNIDGFTVVGDVIDIDSTLLNLDDQLNLEAIGTNVDSVHEELKALFFKIIGEKITNQLGVKE